MPVTEAPGGRRPSTDAKSGSLRIRPYRDADRDELIGMYAAYTEEHRTLGTPPRNRDGIVEWVTELTEDGTNWIAITDAGVVGHAVVLDITASRGELSVYVHPEHFDRGIGTALCRCAVERSADDYEALWLVVERSNTRAIAVFRKIGFEITESHRNDIEMVYSVPET